jgi:hypothetical protein
MRRRELVGFLLGGLTAMFFGIGPAIAQQASRFAVVQSSDGTLYLLTRDGRYTLTPELISDDDLAKLPDLGTTSGISVSIPSALATQASPTTTSLPATAISSATNPVTISGQGTMNTKPFDLAAGNYTVDWTAKDNQGSGRVGCFHGASLKPVTPGRSFSESLGSGQVGASQTATGQTQIYGVPAGQYYVDTTSGCAWTITLTPLR